MCKGFFNQTAIPNHPLSKKPPKTMGLATVNRKLVFRRTDSYESLSLSNKTPSKNPSPISANLSIKNTSPHDILFKIRSTSVEKFKVNPSIGVISVGLLQPSKVTWKSEAPLQSLPSERFQVQIIAIPRNINISPIEPLGAGRCTCKNILQDSSKDEWSKIREMKTAWEKLSRNTVDTERHNILCSFSNESERTQEESHSRNSSQPAKAQPRGTESFIPEETTTDGTDEEEPEEEMEEEQKEWSHDFFQEEMCLKTGNHLWKFLAFSTALLMTVFTSYFLGLIPPKAEYIIKFPFLKEELFTEEPVEELPETWFSWLRFGKDSVLQFFGRQVERIVSLNP